MTFETRKKIVVALLVVACLWPLAHHVMVRSLNLNPWKWFGWSMYTVPPYRVRARAVSLDQRRYLELNDLTRDRAREVLEAYDDFSRRRMKFCGSTPLDRFARADDRFRVLAGPHRGLVATLNAGLELCRGAVVARMDADDWMHRDRLAAQLSLLTSRPELSAVGCRVRIFPRSSLRDGRRAYERWLNGVADSHAIRRDAFVECPIAHPTLMIRREVLAAREGEHALGQLGTLFRRPDDALDRGLVAGRVHHEEFGVAHDHGQEIVEIVGDAAGQLADHLEVLKVLQALFDDPPFGQVLHRHEDP